MLDVGYFEGWSQTKMSRTKRNLDFISGSIKTATAGMSLVFLTPSLSFVVKKKKVEEKST